MGRARVPDRPMRLGTRGSALALAQARLVATAIEEAARAPVEVVPIRTAGDRARPAVGGDKSRFVKELEEALLTGTIDLAVHSAKDLPADLPEGLGIVGVPERGDPRDAVCGADSLEALPAGANLGTSSLRRRAQVLARRPDLRVTELRGNVDTRLRRLEDGSYDALVLAAAGLARLGREEGAPISVEEMTPAAGQGCLALEARADDEAASAVARQVTHDESLARLTAERSLVRTLGATCRTPVGAHAEMLDGRLRLAAFVGVPDGSVWIRDVLDGDPVDPAALGREAAERLLAAGAREVLAAAEVADGTPP